MSISRGWGCGRVLLLRHRPSLRSLLCVGLVGLVALSLCFWFWDFSHLSVGMWVNSLRLRQEERRRVCMQPVAVGGWSPELLNSPEREEEVRKKAKEAILEADAVVRWDAVGGGGVRGVEGVGVVMVYGGEWEKWQGPLAQENFEQFARKHGYTVVRGEIDPARPIAWSKLQAVIDALQKFQWVFYLDADILVMDFDRDFGPFLSGLGAGIDVVATADSNGFNSGAFWVRSSAWSLAWFRRLNAMQSLVDADAFGFQYEQRAFHASLLEETDVIRSHILLLAPCAFNSQFRSLALSHSATEQFVPGDFAVHMAGFYGAYKDRIFYKMLQLSAKNGAIYSQTALSNIPDKAKQPIWWNGGRRSWGE